MTKRYIKRRYNNYTQYSSGKVEEEDFCFEEEDYIYEERKNTKFPRIIDFSIEDNKYFIESKTSRCFKEFNIRKNTILVRYETAVAYEGPVQTKDDKKEVFNGICSTEHLFSHCIII